MTISNNLKENSEESNFFIEKKTREMKTTKPKEKITLNTLLLGEKGVGKTSIGKRLTGELRIDVLLAETYGIDFHFLKVHHQERLINLQIWDVSFQTYECDNPEFFIKNADIIFLIFAAQQQNSFEKLKNYSKCLENSKSKLKYLICNKLDLGKNQTNNDQLKKFCSKYNLNYFEVSTLRGTNFEILKADLIQNLKMIEQD
jgi:GTPase SAR1 family protein